MVDWNHSRGELDLTGECIKGTNTLNKAPTLLITHAESDGQAESDSERGEVIYTRRVTSTKTYHGTHCTRKSTTRTPRVSPALLEDYHSSMHTLPLPPPPTDICQSHSQFRQSSCKRPLFSPKRAGLSAQSVPAAASQVKYSSEPCSKHWVNASLDESGTRSLSSPNSSPVSRSSCAQCTARVGGVRAVSGRVQTVGAC